MRYLLTFLIITSVSVCYGQGFVFPKLKSTGKNLNDFVPEGWKIHNSAFGDLNKDGITDAAIIIQHKDSVSVVNSLEDTVLTQPRILLILFKKADKSFTLIEQSHSFILQHDNFAMDDPFQNVMINRGVLEFNFHIFYNTGSWYITNSAYKFRYQEQQFVMIGADYSSFHRATGEFENYSYNFLTKKRVLTKGNKNSNKTKTSSKSLNFSKLRTLKTFSIPFTWEVEKDIYL